MKIVQKYRKTIRIALTAIVIGLWVSTARPANKVFALHNLSIVGETNLNQFTSYAPQFNWEYSQPAEDYLLKMQLVAADLNRDSLIWESGLLTTKDSSFQFSGLGVFEKGRTYRFYVAAKHPELGWSDSLWITFSINTPPTPPEIYIPPDTIFLENAIRIKIIPATDLQVKVEDLFYQVNISTDSTRQIIVLDTIFQVHSASAAMFTFITEKALTDNRRYYISVRASDGVEYSYWSRPVGFWINRINEPPRRFKLITPAEKSTVTVQPALVWAETTDPDDGFGTGLKEYIVEIATNPIFNTLETSAVVPRPTNKWTFTNCRNHVRYFWRVVARDEAGAMTISDKVYSFATDFGNLSPNPPRDPVPQRNQFMQPSSYFEWTLGEDPDDDQKFSCEIIIWNEIEPARNITIPLVDSLLERARYGNVEGISYGHDGKVRFRLNRIKDLQFFQDDHAYDWKIRVMDGWGGVIESDWTDATFRFDDGINQPPLPPVEGFNPNGTVIATYTPELKWTPATDPDVADRLRYEIILSHDRSFSGRTFILGESAYNQNQVIIQTALLENHQYFWRVRSIDLSDTRSAWSKTNTFWVNNICEAPNRPIQIVHPQNLDEITPETIIWWLPSDDPDPGDQLSYQIECSQTADFAQPLWTYRIQKTLSVREAKTTKPLPPKAIGVSLNDIPQNRLLVDNTLYYWSIRAFDQTGMSGASASPAIRVAFNKKNDPPFAVVSGFSPTNNVMVQTLRPEIRWDASSDPDFRDYQQNLTYQIKISDDSQFPESATRLYTTSVGQTAYTIPEDLTENERWFYRIRACDQHGGYSLWSSINAFVTNATSEAPYPITTGFFPKDSMVVETARPLISWLPTGDPDPDQTERELYYQVRYYYEINNKKKVSQLVSKTGLTSVHLPELKEDQYYYYQIAAVDPDGNRSEWSPLICFGVNAIDQAPAYFQMLSPYFGQDSVALNAGFIWRTAQDKDPGSHLNYTLFYATDSLFSTNSHEIVLNQPEDDSIMVYYPSGLLSFATRYFWKVVATDNGGNQCWASGTDRRPFVFSTIGARRSIHDEFRDYRLHQNYPNPFNVETRIQYDVPSYGVIDVSIYDLIGMKIRTLASGNHARGNYNVFWDGTDQSGSPVANGVYICRLTTHGVTTHVKVVLLR